MYGTLATLLMQSLKGLGKGSHSDCSVGSDWVVA